ncbi:MAG: M67 family metallopeptidase [Nitrososphaerota archaeon]|nr:M67 family metallopeptidase [Aigarchaeota archaeon]MDW8076321.1 M67 family metallopeptidase [Nitrososphaerota archaeon]
MTLIIRKADLDEVIGHALETYPEECCGLLIGRREGDKKVVVRVIKSKNVYVGDRRVRYVVDPLDIYNAEKDAEIHGLMLIGVYHSHPNYPARPSAYDAEVAWPSMTYLIVSIYERKIENVTAWIFYEKNKEFYEESLTIV